MHFCVFPQAALQNEGWRRLLAEEQEVGAVPQGGGQASSRTGGEHDVVFPGAAQVYFPQNVFFENIFSEHIPQISGLKPIWHFGIRLRFDHCEPR